ncbi:MAG: hypothetical protein N2663_07600 [Chlorobi bacterium]|nr:hypothetical protein [Chlorobiota bacterium]
MSQQRLERSVLIVAYHFPPHATAASMRAVQLAELLAQREWAVHVLHAAPAEYQPQAAQWADRLDECGIERYTTAPSYARVLSVAAGKPMAIWSARLLRRPFRTAADFFDDWIDAALAKAEHLLNQQHINIVLGIAPPLSAALAAEAIARRWNVPLAVDFGEIIELVPHRLPSYQGRNHEETVHQLLRSALYASVISRREKEQLLRRCDFLTHEEVGILPHADAVEAPSHTSAEHCRLLLLGDELPMSVLRPLLKLVQRNSSYRLRIAATVPPSLGKLLQKWHLSDRVELAIEVTTDALDRWFGDSDVALAIATAHVTTPSVMVHRACSAGIPVLITGEYAPLLASLVPPEQVVVERLLQPATFGSTLEKISIRRSVRVQTDDTLAREFSRRLGMAMKL